jgi:hypothetical protein
MSAFGRRELSQQRLDFTAFDAFSIGHQGETFTARACFPM